MSVTSVASPPATLDELSELLEQRAYFQSTDGWDAAMEVVANSSKVGMVRGAVAVAACQARFGDAWVVRRAANGVVETQYVTSLRLADYDGEVDDASLAPFTKLRVLMMGRSCAKVTTVAPFASTLRELGAPGKYGIGDAGLAAATALEKLVVPYNPNVTTVAPFASTLRQLDATGSCGIGDSGLSAATVLEVFKAANNRRVTHRRFRPGGCDGVGSPRGVGQS